MKTQKSSSTASKTAQDPKGMKSTKTLKEQELEQERRKAKNSPLSGKPASTPSTKR